MTEDSGARIVFLSVPESLRNHLVHRERAQGGREYGEGDYGEDYGEDGHDHGGREHGHEGHDHAEHGHSHEAHDHGEDGPAVPEFYIDPAIPIPAEIPPGEENFRAETLTWEMMLAGMLTVIRSAFEGSALARETAADHIDYYRHFVLALRPDILDEFSAAAQIKARNGDFADAREILSILRGLFPASPVPPRNYALVLESEADHLENSGREPEAERLRAECRTIWQTLMERDPPWPDAFFNAGFFYMKLHDYRAARECFSAYLPLAEDPRKKRRAETIVREIAGQDLDDGLLREARDLVSADREEEALERLHQFLERRPSVWSGWFLLGWALRRLARWEHGEAAFRKALELGGGNADTLNELAICLLEQKKYAEARRELEKALREDPENVKIISNLGLLALKTGNRVEAEGFFRTVLEISPADPIARQYLS